MFESHRHSAGFMNIALYPDNGHGGNIIQGSLFLDDEDVNGCTEIVPGFQAHLGDGGGRLRRAVWPQAAIFMALTRFG